MSWNKLVAGGLLLGGLIVTISGQTLAQTVTRTTHAAPTRHMRQATGLPSFGVGEALLRTVGLRSGRFGHAGHGHGLGGRHAHGNGGHAGHSHAGHSHAGHSHAGQAHAGHGHDPHEIVLDEPAGDVLQVNAELGEPAAAQRGDIVYESSVAGAPDLLGPVAPHGDCCHQKGACDTCCLIPLPSICWDNLETSFGVQGFTGPMNRGETGSFGFNASANWGTPMPMLTWKELGWQFGVRGVFSNFSGAEFTDNERQQLFLTSGFFHRVDWGVQGGLVVDYLRNDWYAAADLMQLRGEISWLFPCSHEWGFWFTAAVEDDYGVGQMGTPGQMVTINEFYRPTELYAFFYRYRSETLGAEARAFAGWTGDSDGLIGADYRIPIAPRWDLDSGFTYLVPEESNGVRGHQEEAWNLSINLVWYPGCRTACDRGYYRPLFDVADNGTFFVDLE